MLRNGGKKSYANRALFVTPASPPTLHICRAHRRFVLISKKTVRRCFNTDFNGLSVLEEIRNLPQLGLYEDRQTSSVSYRFQQIGCAVCVCHCFFDCPRFIPHPPASANRILLATIAKTTNKMHIVEYYSMKANDVVLHFFTDLPTELRRAGLLLRHNHTRST